MLNITGWQQLTHSVQSCRLCAISNSRQNVVIGKGNKKARWLLIGEAPGAEEDAKGIPFVGRAGKMLRSILDACIPADDRYSIYITNALKCRPPQNRAPCSSEIKNCSAYLKAQINLIKPLIIITMGRAAFNSILVCSNVRSVRQKCHFFGRTPVIATYHPAYLLRTPEAKKEVWSDFCFAQIVMTIWKHYHLEALRLMF